VQNYQPEGARNVAFLSHCGAGKTSLSEALLFTSGAIPRLGNVDDGTTTSDFDPDEVKRKISINLSLLPCQWKGTKINFIDTPGYADFVGEVKSGIRVSEGAIIVVCAASGVEVGTEQVWGYAGEADIPRLIFINKMDRDNADFYRTVEEISAKLGKVCLPIQLPLGAQKDFRGIVDLLRMKSYEGQQEGEIPGDLQGKAESYRDKLVEAIAEIDDDLITKYLEGEELTLDELGRGLREATKKGKVVPILVGSALKDRGIIQLLDAIRDYLPSPKDGGTILATSPSQKEESIPLTEDAPLTALIFKTAADPYVGKLTYLRVYSGSIHSNSQIWNASKGGVERIGQLFIPRGKTQEPVPQLAAGDIGAVAKLALTGTADTLSIRDHPLTLAPISFPSPPFSLAVHPKTKADLDKLGTVLPRILEEDATLQVHKEPDTGETILSGMGETHLEVTAERMLRKFGVEIKMETPKVPYKETVTVPVKAEYKHKKQTGGHGQYGHVLVEVVPLPKSGNCEFTSKIVGGTVPKNYIPSVEKGVNEALQDGVLARYPVVDVRVTLYDGSFHAVDSSDIAFKIAGAQAVKKGLSQGQPILLEPIMNLMISVPEAFTGDTISDLNTKRSKVLGMIPQDGANVIEAQAPLAEIQRYATDLRALTQGKGSYTIEFSHYEEVPPHITQKIISERAAEKG
jgi:elongation factor G